MFNQCVLEVGFSHDIFTPEPEKLKRILVSDHMWCGVILSDRKSKAFFRASAQSDSYMQVACNLATQFTDRPDFAHTLLLVGIADNGIFYRKQDSEVGIRELGHN